MGLASRGWDAGAARADNVALGEGNTRGHDDGQEKGPALLECTGSVAGSHSSRPGAGSVFAWALTTRILIGFCRRRQRLVELRFGRGRASCKWSRFNSQNPAG